jgi:penicillin-binding protein 1A
VDEILHVQPVLHDEIGREWKPANSNPTRVGEKVTIKWGLQQSSNWVTVHIMSKLSPYTLVRFLRSYGIKGQIEPVISMCLGTPDISVCEMVSAYSVFPNIGMRLAPLFVTRIENSSGNTIASFSSEWFEVLDENAAYKTLDMLQAVIDGGTGSRIRRDYGIKAQMGGKTGTTQNNSDAWFMGFTPSLVAGCWVGGEDRSIRFESMAQGQGAAAALPVIGLFLQKVYADKTLGYTETERFNVPKNLKDTNERPDSIRPNNNAMILDDFF